MTEAKDYRDTVFLPKTDFPMKAGLPQKEPGILAQWQADGAYQQLREARAGREKFILHDGPPYANGDMHIGHALNHILKDMVVRTQTLLGKDAPYVPGWDCHGLPIEWKVEEAYRKKKLNKDDVPPVEFRAECRAYAQHWVDTQREQLKRLGIGGDWDHPYLTMDPEAEGTIVAELIKFAESGQLYRGAKPVMWSPVEKTALAEAEVEYEDIVSTQIDVAFEIDDAHNCRDIETMLERDGRVLAIVWTTTPWTIPVNQALAFNPSVTYEMVRLGLDWNPSFESPWPENDLHSRLYKSGWRIHNDSYLVAEELIGSFVNRVNQAIAAIDFTDLTSNPVRLKRVIDHSVSRGEYIQFDGLELQGATARHPMHHLGGFFAKPRPFLPGDFVTTEQGTGLVHMAPDHGEDDFDLCKANGIDPVFAVEGDGKYRADWAWLGGQGSVINAKFNAPDGPICEDLRTAGALLAASADYKHSYPHSWRSKAKVIFRATPQWFIAVDAPLAPSASRCSAPPPEGEDLGSAKSQSSPSGGGGVLSEAKGDGGGLSLRATALAEIDRVRFIPEKGRNRIGSMVASRPDWVISRQRAWGVPITLFVDKKSGQYLVDPEVNARIVEAVRTHGVDAWTEEAAQGFLGPDRDPQDYERQTDILDVWFDSGCTHAFVLESGKWPDMRRPAGSTKRSADLYLEGTDQHRGWFQSSLLESCGTRGRAPYDAVLTHGFTMDAKGMKMSKSLGNTINPLDLMRDTGADILRLWALSVDFTEDHRIGKEILQGVSDQYRKLRNTFRYLLGALDGFSEDERVPVAEMPELERYILHLLADMDVKLKQAVDDFDFNTYTRLLSDFCNNDLSAFFFDIRKDSLYCDAPTSLKRRAYRTVLDTLFHALVRYAAPVLVFTSEEVWGTRHPDAGSVHLLEWPAVAEYDLKGLFDARWEFVRSIRKAAVAAVEPLRREKTVGSGLEADLKILVGLQQYSFAEQIDWEELLISARVQFADHPSLTEQRTHQGESGIVVTASRTTHKKCGRCWRHLPEVTEDGALCGRCEKVLA
jgi:isoleucyl-tRNA synthetase